MPNATAFRKFITEHFNWEELRTLCQDLGVDFDSLPGEGKEAKARELVAYVERHSRLDDLAAILKRERPRAWQSLELVIASGGIRVTAPMFWQAYLHAVSDAYQDWHIPTEFRDLIDWQVDPVPIDAYLILRAVRDPFLLLGEGGSPTSTDTHSQELSQVVDRGAGTAVLITGSSGAGKSTCLKRLV